MQANFKAVEIKAFLPAKDYALSRRFHADLGFVQASDVEGSGVLWRIAQNI